MTNLNDLYKCNICGHVIEILQTGSLTLTCCSQPMEKLEAKTEDTGKEKHVPVIEATETGILVKVGSVEHPMEEKHSIRFIEVLTKDKVFRALLKPGQKPAAEFAVDRDAVVEVREYCNLHGLWKAN